MAKGLEKVVGVLKTHRWRSNICCCDYVLRDRQHLFHWFSIVGQSFCCAVVVWLSHKKKYPGAFKNKKEKKKINQRIWNVPEQTASQNSWEANFEGVVTNEQKKKKKSLHLRRPWGNFLFVCVIQNNIITSDDSR